MEITPLDIQQQQFPIRLRGFDIREVELFLEQIAAAMEHVLKEKEILSHELRRLRHESKGYKQREETFKRALIYGQKVIDQMKANAQKDAELIIAEAEIKSDQIISRSQSRRNLLQDEIIELKRQRIQLETELESVITAHSRLLEIGRESIREADKEDAKVAVFSSASQ
ncbi:MAG: DivIVA domain-containing protein [Desulfobacterales bacterium]|jgi:cell division initiation protein